MRSLGWFILGYMATGVIISYLSTYVILGIVVIKTWIERRRKLKAKEITEDVPVDVKYMAAIGGAIDDAAEQSEAAFDPGNPKRAMIKAWVWGNLIAWPVAVPIGIKTMWNAIKEAENR